MLFRNVIVVDRDRAATVVAVGTLMAASPAVYVHRFGSIWPQGSPHEFQALKIQNPGHSDHPFWRMDVSWVGKDAINAPHPDILLRQQQRRAYK